MRKVTHHNYLFNLDLVLQQQLQLSSLSPASLQKLNSASNRWSFFCRVSSEIMFVLRFFKDSLMQVQLILLENCRSLQIQSVLQQPPRWCNKSQRNVQYDFKWKKPDSRYLFVYWLHFLTSVTVIGHEEGSPLSIVAAQLQLQHVRVESHVAPLDVDGRLLLSSTCGVLGGPVHLIQSPLCGNTAVSVYWLTPLTPVTSHQFLVLPFPV